MASTRFRTAARAGSNSTVAVDVAKLTCAPVTPAVAASWFSMARAQAAQDIPETGKSTRPAVPALSVAFIAASWLHSVARRVHARDQVAAGHAAHRNSCGLQAHTLMMHRKRRRWRDALLPQPLHERDLRGATDVPAHPDVSHPPEPSHGTFTVTGDIARYTSAKLSNQKGKDPVLARFSTVAGDGR
jgi:hypothetical protein